MSRVCTVVPWDFLSLLGLAPLCSCNGLSDVDETLHVKSTGWIRRRARKSQICETGEESIDIHGLLRSPHGTKSCASIQSDGWLPSRRPRVQRTGFGIVPISWLKGSCRNDGLGRDDVSRGYALSAAATPAAAYTTRAEWSRDGRILYCCGCIT